MGWWYFHCFTGTFRTLAAFANIISIRSSGCRLALQQACVYDTGVLSAGYPVAVNSLNCAAPGPYCCHRCWVRPSWGSDKRAGLVAEPGRGLGLQTSRDERLDARHCSRQENKSQETVFGSPHRALAGWQEALTADFPAPPSRTRREQRHAGSKARQLAP